MCQPKFKHDCEICKFLGHYYDHDVYICRDETILARWGNDGPEYSSTMLELLAKSLDQHQTIMGHHDNGEPWSMNYQDYIFSDQCQRSTKAMVLGLIHKAINNL